MKTRTTKLLAAKKPAKARILSGAMAVPLIS
jgi:hypothetical protein